MKIVDPLRELRHFLLHPEEARYDSSTYGTVTPEIKTQQIQGALRCLNELLGSRIHYRHVPKLAKDRCHPDELKPYVWYGQSGSERERCLNEFTSLPDSIDVVMEVWSRDPGESQLIEHLITTALDNYAGPMGKLYVQDVLVNDHSDDYRPLGQLYNTDEVLHVQSFIVEILPLWNCEDQEVLVCCPIPLDKAELAEREF